MLLCLDFNFLGDCLRSLSSCLFQECIRVLLPESTLIIFLDSSCLMRFKDLLIFLSSFVSFRFDVLLCRFWLLIRLARLMTFL